MFCCGCWLCAADAVVFCSVTWGTCSGWCCRPHAHLSEPTQTAVSISPNATSASSHRSSRRASSSTAATAPADLTAKCLNWHFVSWNQNYKKKKNCSVPFLRGSAWENHLKGQRRKSWRVSFLSNLPSSCEEKISQLSGAAQLLVHVETLSYEILFKEFHFYVKHPEKHEKQLFIVYNDTTLYDLQNHWMFDQFFWVMMGKQTLYLEQLYIKKYLHVAMMSLI